MTESHIRVTCLQPELRWLQPMPNMHTLRTVAERIASSGTTDVLVFPEALLGMPAELDEQGQAATQGRQFLAVLARSARVHVVGGTIEHRDEHGRIYNSCFVIDPAGQQITRYDKRRLFSLEADSRTPGGQCCVFQIGPWRLGILICADLWFPELARELCGRIDLLCVPIKSSVPGERHIEYARNLWQSLALTRAFENGYAVAVADWAEGRHQASSGIQPSRSPVPQTYFTCGATTICDPGHRPDLDRIQTTIVKGRPGHLAADIGRSDLEKFRKYRTAVGLLPEEARM